MNLESGCIFWEKMILEMLNLFKQMAYTKLIYIYIYIYKRICMCVLGM